MLKIWTKSSSKRNLFLHIIYPKGFEGFYGRCAVKHWNSKYGWENQNIKFRNMHSRIYLFRSYPRIPQTVDLRTHEFTGNANRQTGGKTKSSAEISDACNHACIISLIYWELRESCLANKNVFLVSKRKLSAWLLRSVWENSFRI